MVKESIGMFSLMKTRGALAPVDDRLRHRCGSLPRDASQRESVSVRMENAEQPLDGPLAVNDLRLVRPS